MNFQWVIEKLKEGKKVKRKSWENEKLFLSKEEYPNELISGKESNHSGFIMNTLGNFEATDWEIYCEEHKWVSAKIWTGKDYCEFKCKNCGIEKPEESLSDRAYSRSSGPDGIRWGFPIEDVKEKVQNAQKRLKEGCASFVSAGAICSVVDKIFKEEFGGKLTRSG